MKLRLKIMQRSFSTDYIVIGLNISHLCSDAAACDVIVVCFPSTLLLDYCHMLPRQQHFSLVGKL